MDGEEERYKILIQSAKTYSAEGKLIEAIHAFEEANKIHNTDKTLKRIKILQVDMLLYALQFTLLLVLDYVGCLSRAIL